MHKVTIVGLGTLQTGKFDADKAEYVNPVKAAIKWDIGLDLEEVAKYNNCGVGQKLKAVIMMADEYEALTSGKNWLMPESSRQKILLAIDALKDSLTEDETEVK